MKKFTILLYVIIINAFIFKMFFINILSKNSRVSFYDNEANSTKQYIIFIDLDENMLHLFYENKILKSYPVASGKLDSPSPVGFWEIVDKSTWGEGFGGSWMGLNVPWGKYGIHGTKNPNSIGNNASHGCFRMFNDHAKELYKTVKIGTPVIVLKGPYGAIGQNNRIIIPGDRGSDVMAVQRALSKLGFYKGNLDGFYGEQMKKSLFEFQRSKGLEPHNEITKHDLKLMGIFPFE